MATLLSKFRIQFHDIIVINTANKKPQGERFVIWIIFISFTILYRTIN